MKWLSVCFVAVLILTLSCGFGNAMSQDDDYPTKPTTRPDGAPWRIAYVQGGEYNDYLPVLKGVVHYLAQWGWLEEPGCLDVTRNTLEGWACIAKQESPYISFVEDAYWTAAWDQETRESNKSEFLQRIRAKEDIDLVIAMGTWAGQDLSKDVASVPVIVMSTSNAIQSGIIESAEDSGKDNVHARVDPLRYYRQVRLFHEIVRFETLGVVYEHTEEGRSYAGMDMVERAAKEFGFQLETCEVPFSGLGLEQAEAAVAACHETLAQKVDAVYITIHRGVNPHNLPRLLEPLFEHNIPNFAMGTLYEVKQGALMSMAQPNFDHLNVFWAQTIAKVLNGATPRKLTQIKEDPQKIAINLQAARMIGFDFPLEVLGAAETIYETIEPAPAK